MRKLLRFAGFHRQPSLGLLWGLLYLEVCKLRSASGIELEITTFRKLLLYYFCFEHCSFFSEDRKSFFCPVLSVPTGHGHSTSRHNMCDFVGSTQSFIAKAEIAWKQWYPYIERCCMETSLNGCNPCSCISTHFCNVLLDGVKTKTFLLCSLSL